MDDSVFWRKCSTCKKPIAYRAKYYVCSVSTCNGQRTGYVFCSVLCCDAHIPGANHRSAAAVEKIAPPPATANTPSFEAVNTVDGGAPRRFIAKNQPAAALSASVTATSNEVLVIASRLKDYISAKSNFNTSQSVMEVLSQHIRIVCDRAIDNARADGRKTVMDRDFDFLKKL